MIKYLMILFISFSLFAEDKKCLVYNSKQQLAMIEKIRNAAGVNILFADILQAMAEVESALDPNAVGDKHQKTYSYGLFQIKLAAANEVKCIRKKKELLNPDINIECVITYYKYLFIQHDGRGLIRVYRTLDAYNRGLTQTRKHPNKRKWKNHKYVGKIIHHMECIEKARKK